MNSDEVAEDEVATGKQKKGKKANTPQASVAAAVVGQPAVTNANEISLQSQSTMSEMLQQQKKGNDAMLQRMEQFCISIKNRLPSSDCAESRPRKTI